MIPYVNQIKLPGRSLMDAASFCWELAEFSVPSNEAEGVTSLRTSFGRAPISLGTESKKLICNF